MWNNAYLQLMNTLASVALPQPVASAPQPMTATATQANGA